MIEPVRKTKDAEMKALLTSLIQEVRSVVTAVSPPPAASQPPIPTPPAAPATLSPPTPTPEVPLPVFRQSKKGNEKGDRANMYVVTCYGCGQSGNIRATCPHRWSYNFQNSIPSMKGKSGGHVSHL